MATVTSLAGCPATFTFPSSVCTPDPTQFPSCQYSEADKACCSSWASLMSWEYSCISKNAPCFSTSVDYAALCQRTTGGSAGSATTTATSGPAGTTAAGSEPTATSTSAAATSPTPTKSGAAGKGGAGRSISAAAVLIGVLIYLMV